MKGIAMAEKRVTLNRDEREANRRKQRNDKWEVFRFWLSSGRCGYV